MLLDCLFPGFHNVVLGGWGVAVMARNNLRGPNMAKSPRIQLDNNTKS